MAQMFHHILVSLFLLSQVYPQTTGSINSSVAETTTLNSEPRTSASEEATGASTSADTGQQCLDDYLTYIIIGCASLIALCNVICCCACIKSRRAKSTTTTSTTPLPSNIPNQESSGSSGTTDPNKVPPEDDDVSVTPAFHVPSTSPSETSPLGLLKNGSNKKRKANQEDSALPMLGAPGRDGEDPIEQQREEKRRERSIYGVPSFKSLNIAAPTESSRQRADKTLQQWEAEKKRNPKKYGKKENDSSLQGIPDMPRTSVFMHTD